MEDDLKISKVEYRSIHWLDLTQILNLNLGDQTKLKKYFQFHVPFLCKRAMGKKIVHSFNTDGHVSVNGSVWYHIGVALGFLKKSQNKLGLSCAKLRSSWG